MKVLLVEVSQVSGKYRTLDRVFTHSPDGKPIPSIREGVGVGEAITQRNRNSSASSRVYSASLTELPTYLIILIKLIKGGGRARSAVNNNEASPLISRQFPITCINYSEFLEV